jgi:uncharacterized membrane protein YqjE
VTADTPPRSRHDLRGAAGRLAAALLDAGRTRLELAAVEFEEARARATDNLVLVLVAAAAFGFALLAASMLVVVLFWDSYRIAALAGMTLVYVLIGVFALWRVSEHKKADPPAFAATLAELERDRAFIASRFGDVGGRE